MLAEITGSLRTKNDRDTIIRDIGAIYSINSPHCRNWTLSEVNIHCQMNSYLSGTIWVRNITSSVPQTMIMFSVMTPYRNELVSTPDTRRFSTWTLNTEDELNTEQEQELSDETAMISSGVCQLHRFFCFFFRIFRWTELYWISRFTDIVGYLNCVTVTLLNVDVLISVWHRPFTIAIVT